MQYFAKIKEIYETKTERMPRNTQYNPTTSKYFMFHKNPKTIMSKIYFCVNPDLQASFYANENERYTGRTKIT